MKETVVNNFNLEISHDEILAIIGQNGAGKSTVLGMIAGFIEPTSGVINCASKRFCPQQNVLWDSLTVEEHIKIYARLNNTDNLTAIESSGLQKERYTLAQNLSGGMKRRLNLAISIIGNPRILLLDEPTTGLDPISRKKIWKFINIVRQNKIVIFTSHSTEEIEHLAQNVLMLHKGCTMNYGSIIETRAIYCKKYIFEIFTENPEVLERFSEKFPDIKIKEKGRCIFEINKENTSIPDVIKFLEGNKSIMHWEIVQESLTNIFIANI